MRTTLLLLAIFLSGMGVFGCRTEEAPPVSLSLDPPNLPGASEQLGPGVHQRTVARPEGEPLRYTIKFPRDYDPTTPLPLVIVLHFDDKPTRFYGQHVIAQLCGPAFRPLPAIIVAPDALPGSWASEENEQVVLSTYDYIVNHYNIDKNKTLLTGFSSGGHGTWYIAGRNQNRFAAAIPIAAQPDTSISDWSIPVYAIHSRADDVVPLDHARDYVREMRRAGANMRLMVTERFPHHRTDLYAKPLRDTLDWLQNVWNESSRP